MAGVMNNTARQYNLKGTDSKKARITVRLKPGFNVVEDEHWAGVSGLDFVEDLKADGKIDFGTKLDKKQADAGKSETAQVKKTPAPKKAKKAS